ncbi:hypothetical protein TWF569_005599 [Orbilia oligospora]|uniref:Uncharacterized protein n=1 Tax=Orbilia oligospora TaxID=2813651 RepID=A0A7C8NLA7_ORBOL|nr:hypothetical protein TWF102_009601 [Orbilia oligospora]KAF3115813.1 hypothetical protein TWF706_005911 [Orbilia oligospora]KAF3118074.1 hypothetical protein TWF103_000108 [Orbilia oligospora]KAF3141525.1 hypothetical protein TWF594_006078 [Orbilia oligospora]KAF3156619.1 hypothetical protein TWF569_005599 [Orbilia oligospora]
MEEAFQVSHPSSASLFASPTPTAAPETCAHRRYSKTRILPTAHQEVKLSLPTLASVMAVAFPSRNILKPLGFILFETYHQEPLTGLSRLPLLGVFFSCRRVVPPKTCHIPTVAPADITRLHQSPFVVS